MFLRLFRHLKPTAPSAENLRVLKLHSAACELDALFLCLFGHVGPSRKRRGKLRSHHPAHRLFETTLEFDLLLPWRECLGDKAVHKPTRSCVEALLVECLHFLAYGAELLEAQLLFTRVSFTFREHSPRVEALCRDFSEHAQNDHFHALLCEFLELRVELIECACPVSQQLSRLPSFSLFDSRFVPRFEHGHLVPSCEAHHSLPD